MKKIISLFLILSLSLCVLSSCFGKDYCEYAKTREVNPESVSYVEIMVKDYGSIVVLLDSELAPRTVENFLSLVSEGFYDGLTFHRVIENFMVQGGDPKADGTGGSDKNVYGEFYANGWNGNRELSHKRGVISMARGQKANSASSQFFICNADSPHLDGNYAAFGYVVSGMSVVDKITKKTAPGTDSGTIENKADQAVIEYIKLLVDYQA